MKRVIIPVLIFACALSTFGQGTFQFITSLSGTNIVPGPGGPGSGQGSFTLDGSLFTGGVLVTSGNTPTGARIHGPAPVGSNAGALFDMSGPTFVAPDPTTGDPGGMYFDINRVLASSETSDLLAGLWYVNIRSDAFPGGDIRGQIVAVPEPSVLAALCLGGTALCLSMRRKRALN